MRRVLGSLVSGSLMMTMMLAAPAMAAKPAPIDVYGSASAFAGATRVAQTIAFDSLATGDSLGNPASLGPVSVRHSTAATFKAVGFPAFSPPSSPNVLAAFRPDDTLAFGDTDLDFAQGRTKAAGLYLVLVRGVDSSVEETTTVRATNVKGDSVEVTVTFRGQVGEQQFVGFSSHSALADITFGVASWSGGTSVIAMDDITIGK